MPCYSGLGIPLRTCFEVLFCVYLLLQTVGDYESQLEEIVRAKFGSAVDNQQHAEVTRFVKLFKPLNKKVSQNPEN